jgi:DNA-binding response OmpR family regulator
VNSIHYAQKVKVPVVAGTKPFLHEAAIIPGMRLLVIEDDQEILGFLRAHLPREGFAVDTADTGRAALALLAINEYDLVILDLNLPDMSGEEIVVYLQAGKHVPPTLMLTVISDLASKVRLFAAGADDYLEKPFSFDELVARIRALLRRGRESVLSVITIEDITIDTARRTARKRDTALLLTAKEFALLEYLLNKRGAIVSKSSLIEHLWDGSADPFSNAIDMHLMNLRKKLGTPGIIHTARGRGYVID